ncbi:hypothetical protein B0O99DRAFT_522143 [Bisporella sp. PMI_857]|nr:hypothetical protein B0O99DRAFT_522143 [Bisporella sp. PMI_857]
MVRTAGIFQLLVAVPTMLTFGYTLFDGLFYYWSIRIYPFLTATFNAFMAAAIVFIILIQRQASITKRITFYFEAAKSAFATAVWLWLLLDSIFGPLPKYGYGPPSRTPRIVRAAVSVVTLLFLFYPTLGYAVWDLGRGENGNEEQASDDVVGEGTPLLRE